MRLLLIAALWCSSAIGADPPKTLVTCKVLSVHDGDTIHVDVLLPWDITIRDQTVRMQGFDAWEITRARQTVKVTDAELHKGKLAKDALEGLLGDAILVYLEPQRPGDITDPHSRMAAYVHVWDGKKLIDVAEFMRDHGHVRTEK